MALSNSGDDGPSLACYPAVVGRTGTSLLSAALAVACTTSPPPNDSGAAHTAQRATSSDSTPSASSALITAEPIPPPPREEEKLVPVLQNPLPHSDAFLSQPLPPADPTRYATFRQSKSIWVGQSHLSQLDRLPDGSLIAMSEAEAAARVYSNRGRLLARHPLGEPGQFAARSILRWPVGEDADRQRFLVGDEQGIRLFPAFGPEGVATLSDMPAYELRWSPDETILVASGAGPVHNSGRQSSLLHWFRRTGPQSVEFLRTLISGERVDGWDVSRDNALLAMSLYPSDDLRVVDLATGSDVFRIPGPRYAGDVALSPDGRFVAVGGQGLLVVDLVNPEKRAFYSHLYNNIHRVRFSPSGDAVAASSYDGRLRIFAMERAPGAASPLTLRVLHELRHSGSANVYDFVFTPDGRSIASASGDQTIRVFVGRAPKTSAEGAPARTFASLPQWAARDPEALAPLPSPAPVSMADGHYVPQALTGAPRPSRIVPGRYACKITQIYKLRDCTVRQDAQGHTLLEFGPGNLLRLAGVLFDDGPVVRFEGWLTEPSDLVGCPGCEKQPLHAVFRGAGSNFQGLLTFRNYHDPHVPPPVPDPNVEIEEANDRYPVTLSLVMPIAASTAVGAGTMLTMPANTRAEPNANASDRVSIERAEVGGAE